MVVVVLVFWNVALVSIDTRLASLPSTGGLVLFTCWPASTETSGALGPSNFTFSHWLSCLCSSEKRCSPLPACVHKPIGHFRETTAPHGPTLSHCFDQTPLLFKPCTALGLPHSTHAESLSASKGTQPASHSSLSWGRPSLHNQANRTSVYEPHLHTATVSPCTNIPSNTLHIHNIKSTGSIGICHWGLLPLQHVLIPGPVHISVWESSFLYSGSFQTSWVLLSLLCFLYHFQ